MRPEDESSRGEAVFVGGVATVIVLGMLAWQLTGCTALETERGRLRTAADTYAAVKHSVADAWEAGHLDTGDKQRVMRAIRQGDKALEEWRKRLESGGPTESPRETLLRATRILREVWMAAQSNNNGEE
jgi:hypothetical protein